MDNGIFLSIQFQQVSTTDRDGYKKSKYANRVVTKISPAPFVTISITQSSISKVGPLMKMRVRNDPEPPINTHLSDFYNSCKPRMIVKFFSLPVIFSVNGFHIKSCVCFSFLYCVLFTCNI